MKTSTALVVSLLTLFAQPLAHAQPDDADALRGPVVPENVANTLVRHDAQGRLIMLEGRPEEAAIEIMLLPPHIREQAREIIADRGGRLNRMLVENIDLVREATDAIRAGDNQAALGFYERLHGLFEDREERFPLLKPLSAVLDMNQQAQFTRLIEDYWSAWEAAEARRANVDAATIRPRLTRTLFQTELRLAFERTLRPFQERLERIYELAEPTPEQRVQLRAAVIDYIRESQLRPTQEQRHELARRLYAVLDDEQRIALFEAILNRY